MSCFWQAIKSCCLVFSLQIAILSFQNPAKADEITGLAENIVPGGSDDFTFRGTRGGIFFHETTLETIPFNHETFCGIPTIHTAEATAGTVTLLSKQNNATNVFEYFRYDAPVPGPSLDSNVEIQLIERTGNAILKTVKHPAGLETAGPNGEVVYSQSNIILGLLITQFFYDTVELDRCEYTDTFVSDTLILAGSGNADPPVLVNMPVNITQNADLGTGGIPTNAAVVTWTPPLANDNVPGVVIISNHAPGSSFPVGTTTVTYTATDVAGNIDVESFTVTILDVQPPGFPAMISTTIGTDAGLATAVFNFPPILAYDAVDGVVTPVLVSSPTAGLNSGSAFPLGTTTMFHTATDAAGNAGTAAFFVTVIDAEAPVVTVPADIAQAAASGDNDATVTFAVSAADNVNGTIIPVVTTSPTTGLTSGSRFPIGETIVTATATDAAGNSGFKTFKVTVTDGTSPVITPPADQTANTDAGKNTASIDVTALGSVSDNVDTGLTIIYKIGTTTLTGAHDFPLGETTVTMDATDSAGNAAVQKSFKVTVSYPGPPEIAVSSSQSGAVADGGSDAQGSQPAGVAHLVTYTISNTGLAPLSLTGTPTASNLINVGTPTITAPLAATIAPGASTTFMVSYTPTLAGAFSFDLDIVNNDGDENPYDITVSGSASGDPEIAVSSSESGAVADGGGDAQGSKPAGVAQLVTYTISNTGLAPLILTGTPTASNLINLGTPTITAPLAATIAPGGNTTFTVSYTPTFAGAFSFDLDIINNDGDENPYDIAISGSASGDPEIAVSSSQSGAVADGGSDAQGSKPAGVAQLVTYTISNTGLAPLTLTGTPTASNLINVGTPTITAPLAATIAPGANTTFTVSYTPTLAGAFSFDLDIINNDGDENPYDITVSGSASGDPEIAVSSSQSGAVADGGGDAQGSQPAGVVKLVTYTINNTGLAPLTLTGTPTASNLINLGTPTITAPASATIAPGANTTFTVSYTPTLAGAFSFDLDIVNNDGDENPYDIAISGSASGDPEIAVSSSESGAVADGGGDAQGSKPAGVAQLVTYTISNTGLAPLTLTGTPTASNLINVGTPTITAPASATIAPGANTTFTVSYTPTLAGAFSFDLDIVNNDGDENPYDITVSGSASGDPEIAVSSSQSGAVADGAGDAQGSKPAGVAQLVTYTISNTGLAPLSLTGTPAASNLINVGTPTITAPLAATIAPGGNTTFTVSYTPTFAGAFSFDLDIVNNDGDENPYDIAVSGSASGDPEIAVSSSESGAVADGAGDAQGSKPAGVAQLVTYTISNTGLAPLSLTGTPTASNLINVGTPTITAPLAATIAPGGNTTFTVSYTPTFAGAFSFDLDIVNNDGDENPYDITVSGSASGDPEIAVSGNSADIVDGDSSPSPADFTDFGPADFTTGMVSRSFKIQNSGTKVLILGDNAASLSGANADDFSITIQPSTTIAPGGTSTVVIKFDPSVTGVRKSTVSIANNDANENPFDFAIAGNGTGGGDITVVQKIVGPDITIDFSSPTSALNFSLTTVKGINQIRISDVPIGTHVVTAADLRSKGYGIASISCDDGDSTTDQSKRSANIILADGEHITCTFKSFETRVKTSQMIADFLGARNILLLAHQPNRGRRLDKLKGNHGSPQGVVSAFGFSPTNPLPLNVAISTHTLSFATSLKRFQLLGAKLNGEDEVPIKNNKWDVWTEGHFARFDDQASNGGSFGVVYGGVDYLVSPKILIGLMGQYDWLNQKFPGNGVKVNGQGWMIGPYSTIKISENFYADIRAGWGKSTNTISPFGTYVDTFDTERWLVSSALIGDFDIGEWNIAPALSLQYISEDQFAYEDSLGITIPQQTVSQGDVRFGPKLSYSMSLDNGGQFIPWVKLEGVYSFGSKGKYSNGSLASDIQGLSGTVHAGFGWVSPDGISLTLAGQYDGIGTSSSAYGGTIKIKIPLK